MEKKRICSFVTLGCKVNQYETDFMTQSLLNAGFDVKPISEESDYVIINTCTVTNEADRKSRQMIRKAKKIATDCTTIAMGCSAQVMNPEAKKIADYQFGNGEKAKIASIVKSIETGKALPAMDRAYWLRHDQLTYTINTSGSKTRQNIMIQEGCTNACTYCKIYHARGTRSVSKDSDLIVKEINEIGQTSCREFILTGINLGEYDFKGMKLPELMKKINQSASPDYRIRLSSLNPEDVTEQLCKSLQAPRFCPHMHLSIQSGSDAVLRKMNRKYTFDTVVKAVEKLRKIDPLFSISCDIIVGFPSETTEDFQNTLDLIKLIKPLKTHVFRYSPKQGTPAAKMKDQISGHVKKERFLILNRLATEISRSVRKKHIGKVRSIIVENFDHQTVIGHDAYYLKHLLKHSGTHLTEGDQVQTKIIEVPEKSEPDEVNATIVSLHEWKLD